MSSEPMILHLQVQRVQQILRLGGRAGLRVERAPPPPCLRLRAGANGAGWPALRRLHLSDVRAVASFHLGSLTGSRRMGVADWRYGACKPFLRDLCEQEWGSRSRWRRQSSRVDVPRRLCWRELVNTIL